MCNVPTDEIIKYIMPVHLSEVGTLAWLQNVLSIILECFEKCKEPFLLFYIKGIRGTLKKRKYKNTEITFHMLIPLLIAAMHA